jgi:Glycine/D-amino acid oxidases (deaminating)
MMQTKERDVVIIGAGVNGLSIAYNLAKIDNKLKITVLEKNYVTSGGTGRCGGGIRSQFTTRETCEIAIKSMKIMEDLSKELNTDIELRQGGYLILAHSDEELEDFEKNVSLQNSLNIPSRILDISEIKEIVPGIEINDVIGASFCNMDGVANPFKVAFGYLDRAREMGVEVITHNEVKDVKLRNDKFLVKTEKNGYSSNWLVNAAGYESRKIAFLLNIDLPILPYEKEIFATEPVDHFLDPMVMSFKKNFYISQTVKRELVGGYSPQEQEPSDSIKSSFSFINHATGIIAQYLPQLKSLKIVRQWAGSYDITPDALSILGPIEEAENFIQANGFSGHGFMLAPFVGRAIGSLIAGKNEYKHVLKNFSYERFKRGEFREERAVVG